MYGLPSLGGRDSGAEDAIEDGVTGFLVDPHDVAALATALCSFLTSPAQRRSMGEAGRRRALELFSWRRAAGAILAR
jgi:glycosyltransferase involved in cell wall biosynthesis